jgi:ssDNA-binding Zn-finger/Zn-ribbon topoisomerase 1
MDHGRLIDNEPGIHLHIESRGQKGDIWLSSIYGSYNHQSSIELKNNEVVTFYCPLCAQEMTTKIECTSCGANMVPFHLDMGGKVNICSRYGCKNHFVEFEDLSVILRKFYEEYGYSPKSGERMREIPASDPEAQNRAEALEILQTGTFLHAYCPHCRKSLIENDLLKLKIRAGEEGYLMLSPYLNVFSSKSTVFLPEEKVVDELSCPHCDLNLILPDKSCEKCGSPVARIVVTARTRLIDFHICTKKGCRWHGLSENDLYEIRLESSMEW